MRLIAIALIIIASVFLVSSCVTDPVQPNKRPFMPIPHQPGKPQVCNKKPIIVAIIDTGFGIETMHLKAKLCKFGQKDFTNGVHMIEYFAIIAAWAGEKDLACEQLAIATRLPGYVSYGQLKLLPYWDPLRGDPRFEKIVASLAPK